MGRKPLRIGVLIGDTRLPYSFSSEGRFGEEDLMAFAQLEATLRDLESEFAFTVFNHHERLIDDLRENELDLVLNFCDTGFRNNWSHVTHIAALLEILELPYTGSAGKALYRSSDKSLVHSLASKLKIPVPDEIHVDLSDEPWALPDAYPVLIKPNVGGGSFGMTTDCVVSTKDQAKTYMSWLADRIDPPEVVIQEFLPGAEYTVGLIGNPGTGFVGLRAAEIDYSQLDVDLPPVFIYDAKLDAASRYWNQLRHRPAKLDKRSSGRLYDYCIRLFRRLALRDYARFDFRAGLDGVPRLIDVNANPVWHAEGRMAMMAGWTGYSYADMLRLILDSAISRYDLDSPSRLRKADIVLASRPD